MLGCFIVSAVIVLALTFKDLDKSHLERVAAMKCLYDLVDKLNETFPGSNLYVESNMTEIKVKGELKYLKQNGD